MIQPLVIVKLDWTGGTLRDNSAERAHTQTIHLPENNEDQPRQLY